MLLLLSSLLACQVMDSPGQVFSPVSISSDANTKVKVGDESDTEQEDVDTVNDLDAEGDGTAVDPLFADPQEDVIQMGAEEPKEDVAPTDEPTTVEISNSDVSTVSEAAQEVATAPVPITAPVVAPNSAMFATFRPATVKDGWRPTLIGTLMNGPTPRAILAMPNGDEKVIHAGDMLSDDGVVVMAIGTNYVELAVIRSTEGRAQIENLTLSSQF